VGSFPTIKYFGPNKERPLDYDGGREVDDIVAFATSKWEQFAPPPEVTPSSLSLSPNHRHGSRHSQITVGIILATLLVSLLRITCDGF
jgi:hypothetical protein